MCITAQCPDPTEPGVWWREDDRWIKYSPKVTKLIKQAMTDQDTTVSLGVVKSHVHPEGQPYVINLQTMTQSNVHSGYTRSIKIVHGEVDQTGVPKVYYKTEGGGTQAYSDEIAREILLAAAAGVKSVSFVTGSKDDFEKSAAAAAAGVDAGVESGVSSGTKGNVVVDFEKMSETQHSGGEIAAEVKIELPWKPGALDNAKMDDKKTLQKKLIATLVDGLMDLKLLDKAMRDKFNFVTKLSANPHMQKEDNGPKQKFVDALCKAAANDNEIIGEILDTLEEEDIRRLQSMNIVFHGPRSSSNLERILEVGLDPHRSLYPQFYVGLKPRASIPYACDKMLLLLVVLMVPSVRQLVGVDVLTIPTTHPELLLPIATADFSG